MYTQKRRCIEVGRVVCVCVCVRGVDCRKVCVHRVFISEYCSKLYKVNVNFFYTTHR